MAKLRRVVLEPDGATLWCWYLYGRETVEDVAAIAGFGLAQYDPAASVGLERPSVYRYEDGRVAYWETGDVEYLDWAQLPESALVYQARDRLQRRILREVRASLGAHPFLTLWKLTYED